MQLEKLFVLSNVSADKQLSEPTMVQLSDAYMRHKTIKGKNMTYRIDSEGALEKSNGVVDIFVE